MITIQMEKIESRDLYLETVNKIWEIFVFQALQAPSCNIRKTFLILGLES